MSKQSQLSIDDILSSVNGAETDFSISNNEPSEVQSIDDILSGFQPASTPSPETEKDEAGFAQFSGKKDMPNAVSTADDAPPSPDFREARMSLDKAQRELAKDKQIAAATAPQTPEVSPTGFKMPKVDMSATDKTTTEDLAATSPIVKKQVESLLAPKQPSIIEADFRDFTTVLPYTAEDGSVRNYEGQQLDKATIRSFFTKDKDGAYQLPNGKAIYSDALFEKFVDEYYKRYNHPILMQDENYRKDYIMRNYGKTEEKFIADATSAMNAQLDRIEEAYEQTRPKDDSYRLTAGVPYSADPNYVPDDRSYQAIRSLRDLRKKINSISKDNFWSGINESLNVEDIVALGIPGLLTSVNQISALNKYVNGEELSPEENLYVQLNMLSQQIDQFRGEYRNDNGLSMNRVGNIVGFMPQFATQIGVTSKIIPQVGAKAVKDITLKAVADTMKKSASEGLKMGLKKVGTSMLNDAIATPFMTMTHKAYADRRLGHYNWEGENLVKENTPWAVDYLKALGETFVERHSEQIGEWVTGGLLYGGKRLAQSKLLDNAFGRGVNRMLNYKLPPMLEQARKNLRVSGYIGEVASEIYNNVINPAFTGETDSWKELLSGRYYWDLLTSIAISTGSFYSLGVPDYIRQGRSIKQLDNSRAKVFANISSQPLKDVLQSAFASDNLEVAVGDLSAVDWKNISAQDAKAASEYIFDTINSKLLQAEAVEAERLQAFMPIVEGVTSSLYSGGSVMAPQMGTQLQTAELKDGSTAFIIWGDVQDADTTQFVVKAADGKLSTINREDIAAVKSMDMSDYLAEQYSLMFSDSINKERLTNFIKDLNTAQQNNASPEAISTIYDRSGYVLFNEGDSVTLTDGSIGVVAGYRDGKYLIAEPTNPDIVSVVGFLNILQPNVDIATAQVELVEDINNGSVEVDTTVDDSYVSEEDILRQKLESAAEQISTDGGKDIYVIRLADGREATVKQGQIVLNEDGTIDTDNSTPTIVIRDAESQAIQQIGIEEVDSVIEELNAQEAIDAVQSSIEEQIAKRDLIAEIFAQKGVVDVILTSGNAGQIVEILTDDTYTFNWIGEDKQTYSITITLDQVAEVLPPKEEKEESAATETDNTESAAEVAEEDTFEGFNPEPINFDKVDWDNISTTDYINLSVLAYGPAETLSRTRGYYLKSKENVEKAQKRVEAQDAVIAKLKAKYADLAGPGEAVKLDKKVREAEAEKVKKIAAVTKLEQEVAKYAKTLEQLGVNIQEEVAIINDRKNLEQQKAELVEADANLDKFAEQGTSEAVNTIVNNEANRNRIYNLYVSRGVAPDQTGITSAVLWDIVTGNVHLRWEDYKADAGNVEKGLGSELGLANSTADKRAYKAVLDKNGMSVDSYVHSLWERMDGYSNELDDMDMKNEVLSVLQSTPNGSAALQTLYDALGIEDAAEESYSMNKAEIAQQIADIDKRIAENAVAQTEFNKKVQNKIDQLEGKNVPTIAQNSQNNNNFAENNDTDGREETNIRRDNIPSLEAGADNSSRVDTVDATGASFLEQSGDNISAGRGDIRVFEQGLGGEYSWSDADSERDIRQAVSQRLVEIAQENGLYIPLTNTKNLGEKYPGRTGESTVYIDKAASKVYKVKNPYAKSALKKVAPQDAIYEHIVHNLLFPEAPYKFEGISKDVDGVRIVLSQPFIGNKGRASQSQIEQALAARGLYPDGRYSYGNDLVSVTDVEGDNVILGEDGTVYFIDPIIKFKKPVAEIIEKLSEQTSDSAAFMIGNFKIVAPEGTSAEKWAAVVEHLKEIIGADNVITDEEHMRQILNNLLQSGEIRTMIKTKGFYSDAERAVEEIKQEKATPQQWLAMLQKNGGLKAGEDKWIGLSDWLKASEKKTLTKQEVLDYIRANKIQIEEVEYADTDITDITDITDTSEFQALRDEFEYIHSRITAEEWRKADKYSDSLIEKYGFQNNTIDMEALSDGERDTLTRLQITDSEAADLAWVEMFDRYGDDFEIAFDTFGGVLSIKDEDAARSFLGIANSTKPIDSIRKRYTTDGLDNLREIALTVPTIDSWQEGDKVHFGDAGEGRAIAWIRFGETTVPREVEVVREVVLEAPFKAYNGHDIYRVKDTNGKHFIIYGKLKNGQMMYVPQINGKYIGETVETAAFDTLEQAQEALVAYYKAHPIRKTINERILVIDEIQSNRHQEGRKRGYESKEDKAALDAIIAAREELGKEQRDFEYRTGQAWQRWQNGEISEQEYNEMWNTQFDAENKALRAKQEAIDAQLSEYKKNKKPGVIPAAPFESNWAELAFKRMLRYAAENGFDKVAWTTGAQQAERYSLNKYFSSVSRWDINTDDMPGRYYTLNGSTKIGINVNEDGQIISASLDELVGKPLSDVVGKEVASKMMEMEDRSSLEDIEFQIGGEGMKAFYDKMLVSFMNKYGKKWGARVGEVTMPELDDNNTMHSVDVTNAMRISVLEGQPMFRAMKTSKGDVYGFTYNGKIYLDPTTMNIEAPIHEYTELWSAVIEKQNPELWAKGKELLKQTITWKQVNSDPNYKNLPEDLRASETLSRIVAAEAVKKINEVTDSKTLIAKLRAWIRKFWNTLKATFSKWSAKDINTLTLREFKAMPLRDFIEGVNPLDYQVSNISGFAPSLDAKELEEIRAERKQIEEQAKANGTWLQAPNGQPTNLTPEQWVTVRTRRFKEWFGDWEKAAIANYLLGDNVVATLSGNEFAKNDIPLVEKVTQYYADNYDGKIIRNGIGEILLDKRSVKDSRSHGISRIKSAAFAAVPQIITEGVIIDEQTNWKDRKYDSVTIAAPIRVGTDNYIGVVVVKKSKELNRFYLHEVVLQKSLLNGDFQTSLNTGEPSGDIAKVVKNIINAKNNSSKIVDANGEPKVIYNGSKLEHYNYDGRLRSKGQSATNSKVSFFTDRKDVAEKYGGFVNAVFLNIRNPYEVDYDGAGWQGWSGAKDGKQRMSTDSYADMLAGGTYNSTLQDMLKNYGRVEADHLVAGAARDSEKPIDGVVAYNVADPMVGNLYIVRNAEAKDISRERIDNKEAFIRRGLGTLLFDSQIKSVDNAGYFDPNNDDIRYTLGSEENSLVGIHNISGAKLAKALKMEGFANPSAAVIDIARQNFESYGEYSFILPKDLVAKKSGKNLGTFDRDAWTPIYPTVIYSHNKTSKANLNKLVEGLDEGLADKIKREVMMKVEGNGFYSGLQIVFLKDKGIELPIATVTPRYAGTIEDLQKLFGDKEVTYDNYKALDQADKNAVTLWIKVRGNKADIERINGLMEKYADKPKLIASYTEEIGYGQFDNLLYGLQADARNSGNPDYGKTIENAVDYIRENNLQEEFDVWETAVISNLGLDEKIQVGWSPSGDRIMRKNTLENVSAYMRKQGKNASNDHWSNSEGKMLAKLAQNFATLEQIRANKHRLLSDVDATMEIRRRMNQAAQIFMDFSKNSNLFLEEQSAYAYLEDILIGGMNPDKVVAEYNKATKRNISLSEEQKAELKELREDMNNIPVQYFETKFDRPVMFSEFAAVVAPNNMPEVIENQLREAGLNIYKYDPDVEGDRREQTLKATASDSIRFMFVGEKGADASQTPPATAKEKSLQSKVEELRAQLKDNKKNLNSTLLRIYELLVSPDFANVMETGIGKAQYRSIVKSIRTAIEQSYGKKDLTIVKKIVDKYLTEVQDTMALLLSRRRLNELTQILNTTVEGYTPEGVRLGKRIDDETRETFKTIRRVLAEEYTPELVERHYEEGTKLVRKPVQYRLRKLTVDGVDINTDFRLKTQEGGIIADLRATADDIVANYGDVPSSEDVKKAGRLLYVANVLESYDEALSLNSEIGVVTEEIDHLEATIKEKSAAHRAAIIGSAEKSQLWDDLKALRLAKEAAIENRAKLRNRYAMFLNTFVQTLDVLIKKGVNDLKIEQGNKVQEDIDFRRGIYRSIKDPSVKVLPSKESDESGKKNPRKSFKKIRRSTVNENLFMGTFAELSKEIDITSIPGSWLENGWYYQFMLSENGYIYRSDWRYNEEKRIQEKIDDKVRSIFGKSSIKDKLFAQSTNPMNVIAYLAQKESGFKINRLAVRVNDKGQVVGGYQENIPLSIGNLLYIRNTVRQPGGKAGYVAWGISETRLDDIVAYVEENYPEYCQFADWVVNELLPELYQMQDAIYFKRFDTHLTQTPFYFPIVRDKRFVGRLPQVGEGEVVMPSSVTGNIVERVKTSAKMDLAADMFSVLSNHIKETLDWCAYSELTRKFNMFSTSRNFRNILEAQDFSAEKLKKAYEIAIGQGKMNNADDGLTRALNSVSKTLVAGNIVFNFNAALKQFVSATAILGYSADPKFFGLWVKNYAPSLAKYSISKVIQMIKEGTINPEEVLDVKVFFDNWRWAIKNVPTMQARWEGGKAGFEVFKAEGVARWDKVTNWITNVGLAPNAFVDMITCANGTRTVYEYQYAKNIKQGMSEEQAHKDACVKAAVLINETQQSSLDGFLSSFQSGGGIARILGVGLGAYQNTSMAFARNEIYSLEQIFRMLKKSTRSRMIDFKTDEYLETHSYRDAYEMAKREFWSAFAAQVSSFLHNAIISNYIWLLATPLSAIVANWFGTIGDEEERKKFWANEVVRKQFADILTWEAIAWQAPLVYNQPILKQLLTAVQRFVKGNNYGSTFESPVVAEIDDLIEAISQQWIGVEDAQTGEVERKEPIKYEQTVEYIVWAYLLKSGTSLSQRIISNIADGIKGMIEDGVDPVDIMNILSSPRSITRAIAGEPREGESQKEYLDRMSYVYRMINAGSGDYDSKWQKERIQEYIRNNERPLYEAMGIDPLEVTKFEAHRKAIEKSLLLQRSGNKAKVKDKKVEEYKALSARGKEYQSQMFTLSVQIKALDQRLDTMIEFDSERSDLLRQKYNLEKELYDKWQNFIKL